MIFLPVSCNISAHNLSVEPKRVGMKKVAIFQEVGCEKQRETGFTKPAPAHRGLQDEGVWPFLLLHSLQVLHLPAPDLAQIFIAIILLHTLLMDTYFKCSVPFLLMFLSQVFSS